MRRRALTTGSLVLTLALTGLPLAPVVGAAGHPHHQTSNACSSTPSGHGAQRGHHRSSCGPSRRHRPLVVVFKGTVITVDATSLTVELTDNLTTTVALTDTTLVVTPDGDAATVAPGDDVRIKARVLADGSTLAVIVDDYSAASSTPVSDQPTQVTSEPTQEPTQVTSEPTQGPTDGSIQTLSGTITSVSDTALTVQTADGVQVLPFADQVSVQLAGGTQGTIAQVPVGVDASIYLHATDGGTPQVVGIVVGGAGDQPTVTPDASLTSTDPSQEATQVPSQETHGPRHN